MSDDHPLAPWVPDVEAIRRAVAFVRAFDFDSLDGTGLQAAVVGLEGQGDEFVKVIFAITELASGLATAYGNAIGEDRDWVLDVVREHMLDSRS